MKRWALINNGEVVQVVVQDTQPQIQGQWFEDVAGTFGPGDRYDGAFSKPLERVPPRHITPLAFLSRFTDAEAVAIDLASIGATAPAAGLRRYLAKVNAAKYIDLDRADTRAGVQALEAATLLAAGRALQILDNPVQPSERP